MTKPPKYWNKAKNYLSKKDNTMKILIKKYRDKTLTTRKDIFFSLVKSITGQQISVSAASSVFKKIYKVCNGKINPKIVKGISNQKLQRLGANIQIKKNKALIKGKTKFIGAELMSSDLRASVALVLAAIVSVGRSYINRIYHLDRGYEKIENKLKKIGVQIKRLK